MAKPANCEAFMRQTPLEGSARTRSRAAGRGPPVQHGRARSCELTGKPRLFHLRSKSRFIFNILDETVPLTRNRDN